MFMTGTSVYAGELQTGIEATAEGPDVTVADEQLGAPAPAEEAVLETVPIKAEPLGDTGTVTAKTITYATTSEPSTHQFDYDRDDYACIYRVIKVKTKGKLWVDAVANANFTITVGKVNSEGNIVNYKEGYVSADGDAVTVGGVDVVSSGTYCIALEGYNPGSVVFRAYVISYAKRYLPAGKTMLASGYKGDYKDSYARFRIKPSRSGCVQVDLKEYGYNTSGGYVTLLNKNGKKVSDKLWYYSDSDSSYVVFGVKKGKTYYLKVSGCSGTYDNCYAYGIKYKTKKATLRSKITKKSKAKKLTRKAKYISTVMLANNSSGNQWYKFKVTKKRKTVIKVNATRVKSGTTKIYVYCGSKKIGEDQVYNGKINTYTITNSTTYGKAKKGTYYIKIHKNKKANGVYKIKYAQ